MPYSIWPCILLCEVTAAAERQAPLRYGAADIDDSFPRMLH